jgi:hypothetical protein
MPKPQAPKTMPRKISVKEIGKPMKMANSIAPIIRNPMISGATSKKLMTATFRGSPHTRT